MTDSGGRAMPYKQDASLKHIIEDASQKFLQEEILCWLDKDTPKTRKYSHNLLEFDSLWRESLSISTQSSNVWTDRMRRERVRKAAKESH